MEYFYVAVILVVLYFLYSSGSGSASSSKVLDPTKRIKVKLVEKKSESHDVRRFRFALPNKVIVQQRRPSAIPPLTRPLPHCQFRTTCWDSPSGPTSP